MVGNKNGDKHNLDTASEIDKILIDFAHKIVSEVKNLDTAIYDMLKEVGERYQLSHISVFEHEFIGRTSQITYQWSSPNITIPHIDPSTLVNHCNRNFEEQEQRFDFKGMLCFDDVAALDQSLNKNNFYDNLGIKSLLQIAIYDGDRMIGGINYENYIHPRKWSNEEKETLFTLSKVIGSYIIKQRNKQELDHKDFFIQEILKNQKLNHYAIKDGSYELLFCSNYTSTRYPNSKVGEMCYQAIFGREIPCELCPVKELRSNRCGSFEAYDKEKEAWYSTTASDATMPNGQKINLVCTSDVTGFMERVSYKDYLTGLLTLSSFEVEAMKLITLENEYSYAILYVDFDKFKNINDEWGYSTGNEVLIYYAKMVNSNLLPTEIACRISEDKFLLLLRYKKKADIIGRIEITNEIISKNFKSRFPKINYTMTGGLYYLTPEDKVLSIIIDKANQARKTIKGVHKSKIAIYDQSLHMQLSSEKMIINHMYEALNNHEFIVYMQPKIELKTNRLIGAEALVRWKQPSGKLISPQEFIPVFEKNGFILELDFYVYEKTMIFIREWIDKGKKPLPISINVSKLHLYDTLFIQKFEKLIDKYKIPAHLIELELTESIFFKELDRLVTILNYLRKKGFLISIDDFGSGYSSLILLKTLPVDILKIDRDFFRQNQMDKQEKTIILSIITMAKGLGLKVLSEGIETEEQVEFLKNNHCDLAQGFWFYQPMPMQDFFELVDE